jgi:hypothetical protein
MFILVKCRARQTWYKWEACGVVIDGKSGIRKVARGEEKPKTCLKTAVMARLRQEFSTVEAPNPVGRVVYLVAISFVGSVSGKPDYLTRPTKRMK